MALAVLSAGCASAADLSYPVKAPEVAPPVTFSWTGFYIGANAGWGGGTFDYPYSVSTVIGGNSGSQSVDSSGGFGGGQIGYNFQFDNNVVLGAEADFQWSGIDGSDEASTESSFGTISVEAGSEIKWFGTLRGRLGYAWDHLLVYATVGAAYGKVESYTTASVVGNDFSASADDVKWGWTVGGGVEYAFAPGWSFKAEYLYIDLGSQTVLDYSDGVNAGALDVDTDIHTVRAGINYRF